MSTAEPNVRESADEFVARARPGTRIGFPSEEASIQEGFRSPAERRRVLDWLEAGIRPDAASGRGSLRLEFPLVFDPAAASHQAATHFTLWHGNAPASFCTLWATPYRIGGQRLETAMISFVYTDPSRRGLGYARQVIEAACARAVSLEIGLVLLWSDLEELYRPLGFSQVGAESLFVLDHALLEAALAGSSSSHDHDLDLDRNVVVDEARPGDWPDIERIRNRRTSQLELDPGEIARAQSIPKMSARVARSPRGVEAFALRGRGEDFEEVIHEWGGDTRGILRCCQSLLETNEPSKELLLISPRSKEELTWSLRRAGARPIPKSMCWMRIASAPALARDLATLMPHFDGLRLSVGVEGSPASQTLRIETTSGETTISAGAFLESLFGPSAPPATADSAVGPRAAGSIPGLTKSASLPLPFFVWGLESI